MNEVAIIELTLLTLLTTLFLAESISTGLRKR